MRPNRDRNCQCIELRQSAAFEESLVRLFVVCNFRGTLAANSMAVMAQLRSLHLHAAVGQRANTTPHKKKTKRSNALRLNRTPLRFGLCTPLLIFKRTMKTGGGRWATGTAAGVAASSTAALLRAAKPAHSRGRYVVTQPCLIDIDRVIVHTHWHTTPLRHPRPWR
jgi:hypothetical protein